MKRKPDVVLLMGGSGTIGQAVCKRLASHYQVVCVGSGRDSSNCSATATDYTCDWRDPAGIDRLLQDVVGAYGRIDCLINAAGIWSHGPLTENSSTSIQDSIQTNLLGPILMARAVVPVMSQANSGLIVFMNSQAGLNTFANRTVYNAAMWGLTGFAKALQKEVSPFGIRVTSIHAAKTDSPFFAKAGYEMDLSNALTPDEIAGSIQYLLSINPRTAIPEIGMKRIEYNY